MFIEASPRQPGDTARIISPLYSHYSSSGGGYECLTFYYHMYGEDMGTLNVYQTYGNNAKSSPLGQPLWTLSGDQGDQWHVAQVRMRIVSHSN